jgi:hypothetical protein
MLVNSSVSPTRAEAINKPYVVTPPPMYPMIPKGFST